MLRTVIRGFLVVGKALYCVGRGVGLMGVVGWCAATLGERVRGWE